MDSPLISKGNDCKDCYKCIRGCPTKSISFVDNRASIIPDECILCGTCYLACPQGAKVVRDDIARAKSLIKNNPKVIVSLAPSFIGNYYLSNIADLQGILKKLGFFDVEETARGADLVKKEYEVLLKSNKYDVLITSCCTAVNLLIKKHYPDAIKFLAPVLSPMETHGKDIKERYPDAKVVFVGPCIAKKDESDNSPYVDVALTFKELETWLKGENLTVPQQKSILNDDDYSKSRLFPTTGGILSSMNLDEIKGYKYVAVDGIENCILALKDILAGNVHNCLVEMSSCVGSCINGPVIEERSRCIIRNNLAIKEYAGTKDFKQAIRNDILKEFKEVVLTRATPSEEDIANCLKEMGKTSKNKELNCGCCGYNTCRNKAIAIIQGKAVKEMCLPYLMEKAKSLSNNIVYNTPNGLMVLNENLEIQLVNSSMLKIVSQTDANTVVGKDVSTLFDPANYAEVLGTEQNMFIKQKYLADYNKYVEETIVYDKKFNIIISIMKDITENVLLSQERNELIKKSIEITDKVIDKNMKAVQEIASLLGESAAETKVALTSLKESLSDDKK